MGQDTVIGVPDSPHRPSKEEFLLIQIDQNPACAEALARLISDQVELGERRRARRAEKMRPRSVPVLGARRRDSLEGYVVCLELGEATVMAEGGMFSFQVPAGNLSIGRRVRFVREGEQFELI